MNNGHTLTGDIDFLVGIGGAGMSALATALVRAGRRVAGADRTRGTIATDRLERLGVTVCPNDGSGVTPDVARLIVSTAIEDDNPDLVKARALGIPVVHRAAALADALSDRRLVAVAGTCGKSSVTALLGHVLAVCGFDPFVVDGAPVVGWDGAVRYGRGAYAVAEVDESDKSLTAFHPYAAIVTNASADHYSEREMNEVFDAFIRDVPGPVVDARGETYPPDAFAGQNASLAVRMAVALGADPQQAAAAVRTFPGVERRLEHVGANVYDDYAHNPEKLRALVATLKKRHPGGLCVVWRPHGYGPLRKMKDALAAMFGEMLDARDRLILLPVYDAGGTADRSVSSGDLAARVPGAVCAGTGGCAPAEESAAAIAAVADVRTFAAVAVCGARDPQLPALARMLAAMREGA